MNFYDPIGFFYTCYKEHRAVEYSIKRLRRVYPDAPIYLVSEGADFSYLEEDYDEISTHLEEDTMSPTFHITGDYWQGNFRERNNQEAIHKCAWATLTRLEKAIDYCKTEYMVMCDPDVLVRGELTIPEGAKLLGTRLNQLPPEFKGLQKVLTDHGGIPIDCWGAQPCVFHTETFLKALSVLKSNRSIMEKLSMEYYALHAHDLLLPLTFALVGEEETFNPDIIECERDGAWQSKPNPLVHQFRVYYE